MDMTMLFNILFATMAVPCVALLVYGAWLAWSESAYTVEDERVYDRNSAVSRGPTQAGGSHASGGPAVRKPAFTLWRRVKLPSAGIAFAVLAYVLFSPAGVISSASFDSPAQTAQDAPALPGASFDYFPAQYPNNGRGSDGKVMTFEHD